MLFRPQSKPQKETLDSIVWESTRILSEARADQMTLFKLLADGDVDGLSFSYVRSDGGYEKVLMFPKLIDHFIYDLQDAVIAFCNDLYIFNDDHFAGPIDHGQLIMELIQTRRIVRIEDAARESGKFKPKARETVPWGHHNQCARIIT